MITFAPLLPSAVVLVLGFALVVAAVWTYRHARGVALVPASARAVAVLVLLLALAEPVRVVSGAILPPTRLLLITDASASMQASDGLDGTSRLATARTALDRLAVAAGPGFAVERLALTSELAPDGTRSEPLRSSVGTDFTALGPLAASHAGAIAVLASDGIDHAGDDAGDAALANAGVVVHTLAVGTALASANAAVRLDAATGTAFPGQDLELTAVVTASGAARGRALLVVVESVAADGTVLEIGRGSGTADPSWSFPISVPVGDTPGQRIWQARVSLGEGTSQAGAEPLKESSQADNTALAVVQVVDRKLAALVLEGQPWWDTSFAVRAWRRDRQVTAVTRHRVGGKTLIAGGTVDLPLGEAIAAADLIVIGRAVDRLLDPAAASAVVNAVERGAGCLFLAVEDRSGPLAAIEPVLWAAGPATQVLPLLTPAGRRASLLPADLRLATVATRPASSLRPAATVLLGSPERPLIVLGRHGAGRVATVNAEGTWRWALGDLGEKSGSGGASAENAAAERCWRQLARTLVKDVAPPLSADRDRYRTGQRAVIAVRSGAPAQGTLTAQLPDGSRRQLAVGDSTVGLDLVQAGLWRISSPECSLAIPVDADVREITDLPARPERLARLASATGGRALIAGDRDGIDRLAADLRRRAELLQPAPRREPLLHSAWWVVILTAALALEWWLRRTRFGAI